MAGPGRARSRQEELVVVLGEERTRLLGNNASVPLGFIRYPPRPHTSSVPCFSDASDVPAWSHRVMAQLGPVHLFAHLASESASPPRLTDIEDPYDGASAAVSCRRSALRPPPRGA